MYSKEIIDTGLNNKPTKSLGEDIGSHGWVTKIKGLKWTKQAK